MKKAYLILTDSGGIQEEAPALGKPTLVLREKTERFADEEIPSVQLIGTEASRILQEARMLIEDQEHYNTMSQKSFFYGNGKAAERIVEIIKNFKS